MTLSLPLWARAGFAPVVVTLVLFSAGCSSDPAPGRGGPSAPRRKAPTPMAGQEAFFNGQILAQIHVGTDGVPNAAATEGRPGGGGGEGHGRRRGGGGNGQMSLAGGAAGFGGNVSGGVPFGAGGEGRRGPGGESGGPAGPRAGMMGGGGRPVMIHLRFTNQGTAAVTLMIDAFTSPLGNFAVRPEKLVIEPGQTLETEPMSSQLAGAFTEVDATLVLRLGPQGEKKTFHLNAVKPPEQAPDEPPGNQP